MTPARSPFRDVRMKGFAERARVSAALDWVDRAALPLASEMISLEAACGRVLAEEVVATVDVPPFARSAMDGYAVRGLETVGASEYNPLPFRLVGETLPGRPHTGELAAGQTVRIMTGAPVPRGADAVVPAEWAEETAQTVQVQAAVPPGKNVGPIGEDVRAGTRVLPPRRILRPQDVGLLASIGFTQIAVVRAPRVRIIATGNELAIPGAPRSAAQIIDSNSIMLQCLVERDRGTLDSCELVADDREQIRSRLAGGGVDVVLVSGGSSVGAEDFAPALVAELGELAIHGVAMRPSSPAGMGRIGTTLVFLLPGNPVSCLCAYDFFAGRAIRLLGGRSSEWPYRTRIAPVGRKIVSAVGRTDYVRVKFAEDRVEPIGLSGASLLSTTTRADGFVVVPEELEGYPTDSPVTVYLYDAP